MQQKFVIKGRFPSRNELENLSRQHWSLGHKKKKEMTNTVYYACKAQKLRKYRNEKIKLLCRFYEINNRRDPDNIFSGAIKAILDGIVKAGIINDDSQRYIKSIAFELAIDRNNPRIEVFLTCEEFPFYWKK